MRGLSLGHCVRNDVFKLCDLVPDVVVLNRFVFPWLPICRYYVYNLTDLELDSGFVKIVIFKTLPVCIEHVPRNECNVPEIIN